MILRVILVFAGAVGGLTMLGAVGKPDSSESVSFGGILLAICWGAALLLWRRAERAKNPRAGLDFPAIGIAALALALVVTFAVVPNAQQQSGIGSASVSVSGDLTGYGYTLQSEGTVHSDKFEETIVTVQALNTGEASRTPELSAVVVLSDGYENNCSTARSFMWSHGEGQYSEIQLLCLLDLDPDELAGIQTVRITEE